MNLFKKNDKSWILKTAYGLLNLLNLSDFFNQVVLQKLPSKVFYLMTVGLI